MSDVGGKKADWVKLGVEWDPKGLATVRQAAALLGTSIEHFVKAASEKEAERVIKSRKGMMDLNAAAEFLGITRKDVIKLIGNGRLRARRIDGEWFVDQESTNEYFHEEPVGSEDQIELDLRELVEANALMGLETEGNAPDSYSLSWCYVTQHGVLVCPRAAWRKLGREKVVATARDAVRRFVRRREEG